MGNYRVAIKKGEPDKKGLYKLEFVDLGSKEELTDLINNQYTVHLIHKEIENEEEVTTVHNASIKEERNNTILIYIILLFFNTLVGTVLSVFIDLKIVAVILIVSYIVYLKCFFKSYKESSNIVKPIIGELKLYHLFKKD